MGFPGAVRMYRTLSRSYQGETGFERLPGGAWRKIWEGTRPGDKVERYRLYQRAGGRN